MIAAPSADTMREQVDETRFLALLAGLIQASELTDHEAAAKRFLEVTENRERLILFYVEIIRNSVGSALENYSDPSGKVHLGDARRHLDWLLDDDAFEAVWEAMQERREEARRILKGVTVE